MSNDEVIEAMRQRLVVQIFQATQTKVSADDPIVTAALIQGLFMREQSAIVAKEIAKAGADAVERINAATAASEDKLTVALGAAVKAS
ncbi:hypothetical protein TB6_23025, partial [Xanthomonas perforans]|uniref:hypothetical protein n=1 Tax=Xanthomonas perforans TaxID=442694 RepID=UPI00062D7344